MQELGIEFHVELPPNPHIDENKLLLGLKHSRTGPLRNGSLNLHRPGTGRHPVWAGVSYQDKSHAEHESLLSAYERGQVDEASRLLTAYILDAGNVLAALLERSFPESDIDS